MNEHKAQLQQVLATSERFDTWLETNQDRVFDIANYGHPIEVWLDEVFPSYWHHIEDNDLGETWLAFTEVNGFKPSGYTKVNIPRWIVEIDLIFFRLFAEPSRISITAADLQTTRNQNAER